MSHALGHSAAHDAILWVAAAVLVAGGGVFLLLAARDRRSGRGRAAGPSAGAIPAAGRSMGYVLAGASLGAGAIHLAAAPSHYVELGDLGAGFLVAAAFQFWWAHAALRRLSPRVIWLGIVVNAAIVLCWAWTRSVGLPLGPAPGSPEPIGLPDGAATLFELVVVTGLVLDRLRLRLSSGRGAGIARSIMAASVVPAIGLILIVTSLATFAIATGRDHGVPGSEASLHSAITQRSTPP